MRYVLRVPLEVSAPISRSDPDVRSLRRLPGFVRLEQVDEDNRRYELTVEIEGGSRRDAMDAAEELIVEYESALGAYRPRLLAGLVPEAQ
jgi:hypothetical protein